MPDIKNYLTAFLTQKKISVAAKRAHLFDQFAEQANIINAVKQIIENQTLIMINWDLKNKIDDILNEPLIIPNGTVNKAYEALLDFNKFGSDQLVYTDFEGLEQIGLEYHRDKEKIFGTPIHSGDFKIKLKFRIRGETDASVLNEKILNLVINPDPKTLWKNIPSDIDKDDAWRIKNFWKPDNAAEFSKLSEKYIVVASKRGRSHATVGSFRDDHYSFKYFEQTAWSLICVADGAGSAKLSREGSKIACEAVVDYFEKNFSPDLLTEFDAEILNFYQKTGEDAGKKISKFVYEHLSKAAYSAHNSIDAVANKLETNIKDFHSTLIFALYKKYNFGYAVMSFGVGDCPIGLINKDETEIKLMNWLDVGEFGGGTRFITMPEIFNDTKFSTRFGFKLIDDFSYLMLMTDGIYDPKFVVEDNLEKIDNWKKFIDDLKGENEEKKAVKFDANNTAITQQLSEWMDFWSAGNHDDRTLAIVF